MSHKATHIIHVTGKAEYTSLTHDVIDTIMSNDVGNIIINAIGDTGKNVTVHKRSHHDIKEDGTCNDETHAESRKDSYTVGDSRTLYRNEPDDPRFPHVRRGFKGTGKGSDSSIHFDPDDSAWNCDHAGPAADYDDSLVHELVHALRDAQGLVNYIPTEDHGYETVEEFLAIVVTNVYVSAKGGTSFRADHDDFHLLSPKLSTSAGFIHDIRNFRLLRKYRREWLETFAQLARVRTSFNPFREMLHYPPKEMSPMHRSHEMLFQHVGASHLVGDCKLT